MGVKNKGQAPLREVAEKLVFHKNTDNIGMYINFYLNNYE